MNNLLCPKCHFDLQDTFYFCPHCGKKIKEPPLSTSIMTQLSMYALSIFVPPFGIIPAIKYLFAKESQAKMIGVVTLLLTIVSTVITIWITMRFVDQINSTLNSQLQLNGY